MKHLITLLSALAITACSTVGDGQLDQQEATALNDLLQAIRPHLPTRE